MTKLFRKIMNYSVVIKKFEILLKIICNLTQFTKNASFLNFYDKAELKCVSCKIAILIGVG